ncbi:MAG: glycosyltransferase, partial [Nitrospinae bacterium]|nr:glycosyltransferase [Nitrospinota bacterium]
MAVSLALSTLLLLIAWMWLRLAKREVSLPIWSTLELPDLPVDEAPLVSIILPVRNEAHTVVRCVESLLRQDYGPFEIIVIDGQSSDGTWERLQEMQEEDRGTLRVLRGDNPPPGWLRKAYAVQQGVEMAKGEWLLFTAADSYHMPGLLCRAMAYTASRELAMLLLAPRHECRSFWEHVLQPLALQYLDFILSMGRVCDPRIHAVWTSGAFLLIARDAYAKAGGHTAVASEIYAEYAVTQRVQALGSRIECVKAVDLLHIRMYQGLYELWEEWSHSWYV